MWVLSYSLVRHYQILNHWFCRTLQYGLQNGGPAGLFYGYLVAWSGAALQAIVMAEMASMYVSTVSTTLPIQFSCRGAAKLLEGDATTGIDIRDRLTKEARLINILEETPVDRTLGFHLPVARSIGSLFSRRPGAANF